jgi:hypothetical protein
VLCEFYRLQGGVIRRAQERPAGEQKNAAVRSRFTGLAARHKSNVIAERVFPFKFAYGCW